jgi:hypothetical protein
MVWKNGKKIGIYRKYNKCGQDEGAFVASLPTGAVSAAEVNLCRKEERRAVPKIPRFPLHHIYSAESP